MLKEADFTFGKDQDPTVADLILKYINLLPQVTNNYVVGTLELYDGPIFSHKKTVGAVAALAAITEKEVKVDIQDSLGLQSNTGDVQLKVTLRATKLNNYSYVLMYSKNGIAEYPVTVVLDDSISQELNKEIYSKQYGYIYHFDDSVAFDCFLDSVFSSKRLISVIQEIITGSEIHGVDKESESDSE